jgi:hypothetical protein
MLEKIQVTLYPRMTNHRCDLKDIKLRTTYKQYIAQILLETRTYSIMIHHISIADSTHKKI